jgi:hypothetical protein
VNGNKERYEVPAAVISETSRDENHRPQTFEGCDGAAGPCQLLKVKATLSLSLNN